MRNGQLQLQTATSDNTLSQRVEGHQTNSSSGNRSEALSRAKNSWKRMRELAAEKENESKRPPWRAVSVSTLPKPDKSALLRAKLLDASRRLRAGKSNAAIQTDFVQHKLLKEASIGVQKDLIFFRDIGILTDGQFSIRKEGYQQYVLTYSVSQMTDCVGKADVSTQTLLPKASLSGIRHTDMGVGKNIGLDKNGFSLYRGIRSGLRFDSTMSSWNFDDDALKMRAPNFIPYTIEPNMPCRSFVPLPFYLRGNMLLGRQKIDWFRLLHSLDQLIHESNHLLDMVKNTVQKQHFKYQGLDRTFDYIREFQHNKIVFPSEYWLPIIESHEEKLKLLMMEK